MLLSDSGLYDIQLQLHDTRATISLQRTLYNRRIFLPKPKTTRPASYCKRETKNDPGIWGRRAWSAKKPSVAFIWVRGLAAHIAGNRVVFVSAASYKISRKKALRWSARSVAFHQSVTATSMLTRLMEGIRIFCKDTVLNTVSSKNARTGTKLRSN